CPVAFQNSFVRIRNACVRGVREPFTVTETLPENSLKILSYRIAIPARAGAKRRSSRKTAHCHTIAVLLRSAKRASKHVEHLCDKYPYGGRSRAAIQASAR